MPEHNVKPTRRMRAGVWDERGSTLESYLVQLLP